MTTKLGNVERPFRLLQPSRVCLITGRHAGKDNVMSASWVFPLSGDPELFGVSVSPKRFSFNLIRDGGAYGINIPGHGMEDAVAVCGTKSGKDTDKFKEARLTKEEGKRVPLIKECDASIECEVVGEKEAGDHVIFIGKVVSVVKRFGGKGIYQAESGFVEI